MKKADKNLWRCVEIHLGRVREGDQAGFFDRLIDKMNLEGKRNVSFQFIEVEGDDIKSPKLDM